MQYKAVLFENIGKLITLDGAEKKHARYIVEADLSIIENAQLLSLNGRIAWVGHSEKWSRRILSQLGIKEQEVQTVSLGGATVLPGFVESHTHLVFAGERFQEFEWRIQGKTYQEIAAQGGGILSTVKSTRQASEGYLLELAQKRVSHFTAQGVTTLECKSGYGLDLETELRVLQVARKLTGPKVVSTYLGAHSLSPDFLDVEAYLDFMKSVVLPEVARLKLAERADIYVEKGFFTLEQATQYLTAAVQLGFKICAHVEQLSYSSGAELVLGFKPQSLDHLVYVSDTAVDLLSKSDTTAVLLPTSDLYLRMQYPPARKLLDRGVRIALSTDFNPGTSPTQDLSVVGLLARLEMRMTLPETIVAYTLGGAFALGLNHEIGSLVKGKFSDFIVLDCDWQELFYSAGKHPVAQVYRQGQYLDSCK